MVQLVMVILALSLSAAMALASINYIPADRSVERGIEAMTRQGLNNLRDGWEDYRLTNGVELSTTDGLGVLTPRYVFIPPVPVDGLRWSYGGDPAVGYYFCPTGAMTEMTHAAMERTARFFSPQAFFLDTDCGSLTSAEAPTNYPSTRSVTLWVARF